MVKDQYFAIAALRVLRLSNFKEDWLELEHFGQFWAGQVVDRAFAFNFWFIN